MLYSPTRVAIAGIGVWAIFFLLSPLQIQVPTDWLATSYIALCYLGFFGGCWLFKVLMPSAGARVPVWDGALPTRAFWLCCMLGAIGMMVRIYDRVFIRGIDYSLNELDVRERLIETGGSIYGAASSVLLPFSFIPLIILLASKYKTKYITLYILAFIIFTLPMIESLQILSRSIALITAMLFFSAWVCLKFGGQVFRTRVIFSSIIGLMGFVIFSTAIFASRLEDMDFSLTDSVVDSGYAYTISPNRSAIEGLLAGSTLERTYYSLVVPNAQYYLHGFFEFGLLFDRPDGQRFGYGTYSIYPYTRALSFILDEQFSSLDDSIMFYRPGVYVTFFGPWWVDFGWIGVIIMIPLGYLMSVVAERAKRGDLSFLPLHLFHITILFYMMVSNFLTSGVSFYLWHGFLMFGLFTKFSSEKNNTPYLSGIVAQAGKE